MGAPYPECRGCRLPFRDEVEAARRVFLSRHVLFDEYEHPVGCDCRRPLLTEGDIWASVGIYPSVIVVEEGSSC